ncbi:MAG: hypothetical protein Q8K79_21435 [Solirubrobacteraceae bacterium]|nr:hypothetical protein [Solirubrobacteraceae bacterium]
MPPKTLTGILSVLLIAALVGCGGDDTSSGDSGADKPGKANSAEVKKLIRQTFGPNEKAKSGNISAVVDLTVKGAPRYREPVQVSLVGPFSNEAGQPETKLDVSLALRGGILGGDLYLKGDQAFIGLGSTAYEVPASIAGPLRKPLEKDGNALDAIMGVFSINPDRWAKNPRIVGNERVAGIDTIHGTADINTENLFLDLATLAKRLTALRITEITGLPREVDAQTRAALDRSVKTATGDVYTGADDKVLRRAKLNVLLEPSAKDRKLLKFSSIKVAANLDITDVGSPQKINVPSNRGSWDALQLSLDALAEAVR